MLKAYAAVNGADLARWSFLTGNQAQMWDLSTGMKLSVGPGDKLGGAAGMQVMHSSHFLLIDPPGHVRGVYDFKDGGVPEAAVGRRQAVVGRVRGRAGADRHEPESAGSARPAGCKSPHPKCRSPRSRP